MINFPQFLLEVGKRIKMLAGHGHIWLWAGGFSISVSFILIVLGVFSLTVSTTQQESIAKGESEALDSRQFLPQPQVNEMIVIDVSGAVNNPGVYELPLKSRLNQAVTHAGGFHKNVDQEFLLEELNLARELADGEKIVIPFDGKNPNNTINSAQKTVENSLTSINSASKKELDNLPGVGEKWASIFIEKRPYASFDEFKSKTQVSTAIWQKIDKLLTL